MNQAINLYCSQTQVKLFQNAFPIDLSIHENKLATANSDYSISLLSLDNLQPIWTQQKVHNQRIERIIFSNNDMLITCSNDKTIKLFDLRDGKQIHKFHHIDDFYSLASSLHIVAGGSEGKILFYDLKTMKFRSEFNESQNDEITWLEFNPSLTTELLSCSLDGLLVIYDLSQDNEEESLTTMIRSDQPLNKCGYLNNQFGYSISTTQQVCQYDLQQGVKLGELNTIEHTEFNNRYLIDIIWRNNELNYLLGDPLQELSFKNKEQIVSKLEYKQMDHIRHIKYLDNKFILFDEDGNMEILCKGGHTVKTIEQEMNELFQQ